MQLNHKPHTVQSSTQSHRARKLYGNDTFIHA